jgi:hypothetical protein
MGGIQAGACGDASVAGLQYVPAIEPRQPAATPAYSKVCVAAARSRSTSAIVMRAHTPRPR